LEELRKIREKAKLDMKSRSSETRFKIVVGMGTSGIALGARDVMKTFMEEIAEKKITDVIVTQTGEKGVTSLEPVVDVIEIDKATVTYGNVTPEKAKRIVQEHLIDGKIIHDFVISSD
jgi:NADP-reducing hydrogenase subunit HndB